MAEKEPSVTELLKLVVIAVEGHAAAAERLAAAVEKIAGDVSWFAMKEGRQQARLGKKPQ
jgi:hypothetical protein